MGNNVFRSGKDVKLIWRDYAGKRQEHAELKESHRCIKNFYALLSSVFFFFCGCIIGIAICHSALLVNISTGLLSEPWHPESDCGIVQP